MSRFICVLFVVIIVSCTSKNKLDSSVIINKSITVSGGHEIDSTRITFDFRGKHYIAKRYAGDFLYGRVSVLASDSIFDILTNDGFERFINGEKVVVHDTMATKYSSSINSVHYFSVLPYGLNSKAVNKKYLGKIIIKGLEFYKIEVTFQENGGGEDFDDVFFYYVDVNDFKVKYLAYSYNEDDGLGFRFREAYNERFIEGIRFVDYNNYKPKSTYQNLEGIDQLFENDLLELLSKIELKNIKVSSK
ncbi:MAG: DUF6503 family protein [Algibacter sp.]